MQKPTLIKQVDLDALKKICQQYIDFVDDDEKYHEDHNFEDLIAEKAMEVLYGKDVWDWINNRRD